MSSRSKYLQFIEKQSRTNPILCQVFQLDMTQLKGIIHYLSVLAVPLH